LESLEGRALLANFSWTLGADGNFSNAAAWTGNADPNNHAVPGAGDNASIPSGFRMTTTGRAVNSVSGVLQVTSGTLSLSNASVNSALFGLQLDSGATLRTTGGQTAIFGSEVSGTLNFVGLGTTRFVRGLNNLNPGAALTGNGQFLMEGDVFGGPTVQLLTSVTAPAKFLLKNGLIDGPGNLTINGTTFRLVTPALVPSSLNPARLQASVPARYCSVAAHSPWPQLVHFSISQQHCRSSGRVASSTCLSARLPATFIQRRCR